MFASVGQRLVRLPVVVDEENDLGPYQSQDSPSEETVTPLEGVVELCADAGVGEGYHHQKEAKDNPRDNDGGK